MEKACKDGYYSFVDEDFGEGTRYTRVDSRFYDMCDEMKLTLQESTFLEVLIRVNVRNYIVHYEKLTRIYSNRTSFKKMLEGLQDKGLIDLSKDSKSNVVVCMDKLHQSIQSWKPSEVQEHDDDKNNRAAEAIKSYNENAEKVIGNSYHKFDDYDYTRMKSFGEEEFQLFEYIPSYINDFLGTSKKNPISFIFEKFTNGYYKNINEFIDYVNSHFDKSFKPFPVYAKKEASPVYTPEEKEQKIMEYSADSMKPEEAVASVYTADEEDCSIDTCEDNNETIVEENTMTDNYNIEDIMVMMASDMASNPEKKEEEEMAKCEAQKNLKKLEQEYASGPARKDDKAIDYDFLIQNI